MADVGLGSVIVFDLRLCKMKQQNMKRQKIRSNAWTNSMAEDVLDLEKQKRKRRGVVGCVLYLEVQYYERQRLERLLRSVFFNVLRSKRG